MMRVLWILTMVWVLATVAGCEQESKLNIQRWGVAGNKCDPNDAPVVPVISATGKAADTLAKQAAENMRTAQGRLAAIQTQSAFLYSAMFVMFVGGLVFWGFTRSRYGWVIPAASIGGLFLLITVTRYAEYCVLGMIVVTIAVLVWKAVEYQKERNQNGNGKG